MNSTAFPLPTLRILNDVATVTSLQIAEHFEKEHFHVLRDIRDVMKFAPDEFNASNFGFVEYADAKGELRPMCQLTHDGFALIAMGFTGDKAMRWKLAYIAAFNRMERQLLAKAIFDGYLPEAKHDAVHFLRLQSICRKSWTGAAVLSYLVNETALGAMSVDGWIDIRLRALEDYLDLEVFTAKAQIARLEKLGFIETRPTSSSCHSKSIRPNLKAIHHALTTQDVAEVDQFVKPRIKLAQNMSKLGLPLLQAA